MEFQFCSKIGGAFEVEQTIMLPENSYTESFYQLALSFVPDVGPITAKSLIAHFGSAESIFKAKPHDLERVDGVGTVRAKAFQGKDFLKRAELEFKFCEDNGIQILFYNEQRFPKRFFNCDDAPLLLYFKGEADLNAKKVVAIIGTRKNTDYGQRFCNSFVESLAGNKDLLIVSGLALGIDSIAHKASVQYGIPTVGVLGHSLEKIYPSQNKGLAQEMLQQGGGLLSEFPSGTLPDRQNFPVRNRIVAGMSDVTLVVESEKSGGSMITAYLAHSYGREVAAAPGRTFDLKSSGTNHLIKKQIASLVYNADDLFEQMGWNSQAKKASAVQSQLFEQLTEEESTIVQLLEGRDNAHSDELLLKTGWGNAQLASVLLTMELKYLIKTLPGKCYRLN